jgi:hypothetical protein
MKLTAKADSGKEHRCVSASVPIDGWLTVA